MSIKSGVAAAKRPVPRSGWRRWAIIPGCVALFLIVLAAAAHDAIEKMVLERSLGSAFAGDATIGNLYHTSTGVVAEHVHVANTRGAFVLDATRVAYSVSGDAWDVTPDDLHVAIAPDRLAGDEVATAESGAQVLNIRRLKLHLTNARVTFARSTTPDVKLEIAGLGGSLDAATALHYDLRGDVVGDAGGAPFTASDTRWTAASLPVAPFAALLGTPEVTVRDGEAHAVTIVPGAALHATFTLAGVRASIAHHALHDVAGNITLVHDGIGSTGLDGVLDDGTPVAAVGEVHDGLDWNHLFFEGTRDLRALARMFSAIADQPNHRWMNVETTAPGITFGQYAMTTKTTPHVVQLIEVDPHEPTVRFDTALAGDHIISKGARTSDLGLRTNAVVGANGDYFDIGRTYEPQGLLIKSGVLLHGPTDHEAVVFDRTNKPTFARFRLSGAAIDGTRHYPITLLNSWPTRHAAFITPDYGVTLPAAPGVTFAALAPLGDGKYRVTSLHDMAVPMPVVLGIGFGPLESAPLPRVGDVLDVHYALDPPVPGAVAAIGSGPLLLKDGQWFEDKHAPAPDERDVQWPVIAIGTMPAGTLMFVAVDGRHPERSIGMTRPEFAELLRGFGMIDAMALDSGGSVTLVSRAPGNTAVTVRNVPSDFDAERYVSDALFVYSSAPFGTIVTTPRPHVEPTPLAVPSPLVAPTP